MRLLFDTCVLYPTVMRSVLLETSKKLNWEPLWSDRILEEWILIAKKIDAEREIQTRGDIALIKSKWPLATVDTSLSTEEILWLPDKADRHVLAAAIDGSAKLIITMNLKDFPRHILLEKGLDRLAPDDLLCQALLESTEIVISVVKEIRNEISQASGQYWTSKKLFKKAGMPRFAKALSLLNFENC